MECTQKVELTLFQNLKLKRFPMIVISHLVDKELPYKSYFNDVIVSLLFTVKCKSNYRHCFVRNLYELQMVITTCQFMIFELL